MNNFNNSVSDFVANEVHAKANVLVCFVFYDTRDEVNSTFVINIDRDGVVEWKANLSGDRVLPNGLTRGF